MDHTSDLEQMLHMIPGPAFTVQDGTVTCCNQAAAQLLVTPGDPLGPMLRTGQEEYAALESGSLYLSLSLYQSQWGATVTRLSAYDLFCLEQSGLSPELKAMSLLCSQLRLPLGNLTYLTSRSATPEVQRELSRIMRILNNVSNADRFSQDDGSYQSERDLVDIVREVLNECQALLEQADIHLRFEVPQRAIYTALDWQMLRQAIYALLDNAARHTQPGGFIEVQLSSSLRTARLTVTDHGSGISESVRGTLFSRYTRQPSVEDGTQELGLGMTLIRSAALAHGGTVLVETDPEKGTRVTVTLSLRSASPAVLRSPATLPVDSHNDGLVMLSNVLPAKLYEKP